MKKLLIAFGAVIAVLITGAAAAFYYADGEFGIRQAPALPYTAFGGAEADIAARLDPSKARQLVMDIVAREFPQQSGWVESFLDSSLPHEIVLMADPSYADRTVNLTVYVNERRGGPVLAKQLSDLFLQQMGAAPVVWDPAGARLERRGAILFSGTTQLHDSTIADIDKRWGSNVPSIPPVMEGGHLFELTAANRTGALYALVAALAIADPAQPNVAVAFALEEVKQLEALHATANFISDDAMAISLLLQCDKSIEFERPESMRLMLDQIVTPQLIKMLKENYNLTLTGSFTRDGYNLDGQFTLSGLKPLITPGMAAK